MPPVPVIQKNFMRDDDIRIDLPLRDLKNIYFLWQNKVKVILQICSDFFYTSENVTSFGKLQKLNIVNYFYV
jgi:hypothetical protein